MNPFARLFTLTIEPTPEDIFNARLEARKAIRQATSPMVKTGISQAQKRRWKRDPLMKDQTNATITP